MARPDPHAVHRQPMARGAVVFDITRSRAVVGGGALFVDGALDVGTLHRLLDSAEVMVEGATYAGDEFQGTALFALAMGAPGAADQLARALRQDRRATTAIRDHARRALARLLGAAMPEDVRMTVRARAEGDTVRLDVDMEAALPDRTAAGG